MTHIANLARHRWLRKSIAYFSLIVLIILIASAGYFLTYPTDSPWNSLGIGIIASLLTSLVYGFILYALINEPLKENLKLRDLINELRERELSGIENIQEKYVFDPDFWTGLLAETSNELVIIGHALSTWCEEPYQGPFATHVKRIVSSGGVVKLVVIDPDDETHERLRRATGRS